MEISFESFFTREKANEGVKLPLSLPDGTPTDFWIRIYGVDSDSYREANAKFKRQLIKVAALETEEEREKAFEDLERGLRAALIHSWNLPREFTPENCYKLLKEAPQIADEVDRLSARRKLFFENGSKLSSDTAEQSSDSENSSPEASQPSENT